MFYEDSARRDFFEEVERVLSLHAGMEPVGRNDGSVRGVLDAWGLHQPEDFVESLMRWGYTIVKR